MFVFQDTVHAFITYLNFSDLDRSNIGNARLQGLPEDTLEGDKTGVLFDWLVSAFFFSYVGITQYIPPI